MRPKLIKKRCPNRSKTASGQKKYSTSDVAPKDLNVVLKGR